MRSSDPSPRATGSGHPVRQRVFFRQITKTQEVLLIGETRAFGAPRSHENSRSRAHLMDQFRV
ncbi:hypothetical protein, partial [Ralstonia pseudosolanacearum]|uniref:hypothetical protein n=1 Tax=Ralstonia pseudosolanacearum TaxID=1310165 RepID=UPI003C7CE7FB